MKHNELYDDIEEMLADADFQTDFATQEKELKKLRKKIKKGETPQWIIDALTAMHATYPEGQSLRYRSSTNNEDLPGFNGAGLYDSKTQHPEETEKDGVSKSLKQVYASLWNFRAFTERDFHRIDHLAAAMGVLVHPNYSDELANGVAVSFDPIRGTDGSYYVNTQVGEDLVTNPEAHSVPEEILLGQFDSHTVLGTSNQAPPGQLLMSAGQMRQLRQALSAIHDHFKRLYNPASGEPFAMEIEFKITSENVLAIKQARPWVFETASAAQPGPPSTDATLSGLELSGIALSPAFAADATAYTAGVANGVDETSVTPAVNDDGATYAIEIGGVAAEDGVIPLSVGENVITIEVTAADGETVKTYTVTVTRAAPLSASNNATVQIDLSPSGAVTEGTEIIVTMSFANLEPDSDASDVDYIFRADVVDADQCEGKGIGVDRYIYQVDEDPEVLTGAIAAACTPGEYTLEISVSSPDNVALADASATFLVEPASSMVLSGERLPDGDAVYAEGEVFPIGMIVDPEPTKAEWSGCGLRAVGGTAVMGVDYLEVPAWPVLGPSNDWGTFTYVWVLKDDEEEEDEETIIVEGYCENGGSLPSNTLTFTIAAASFSVVEPEPTLSTDATLDNLALSGLTLASVDPAVTQYTASVSNDVERTTVTATTSDANATYAPRPTGRAG